MYDVALPLLVYGQTGSVALMGILVAATPATLLLGPILGASADRRGSGQLVLGGLAVQLAASIVLSTLVSLDRIPGPVVLVVLAVVTETAGATYRVGWMTSVPQMFQESPVRARGTLSSLFVATTVLGPLLVGLLLPVVGYEGLLWVNVVTFLAPLGVYAFGIRPTRPKRDLVRREGLVLGGLRIGFSALWGDPTLRRLTLVLLPFDLAESAALPALALFHLRDTVGINASTVATVIAGMNVAALIGALIVSERRVFRPMQVVGVITVASAGALLIAASPRAAPAIAALTVLTLLGGAGGSAQAMMAVQLVPQEVFGRASGVLRLVHGVPQVLGPLLVAALVPLTGTSVAFAGLAVIALTGAVATLAVRRRSTTAWSITESQVRDEAH
jgi:predicted MFS family arabinose efflux permease